MTDLPDGKLYVAGEWTTGSGAEITSIFPADGSVNRVLKGASEADGLAAIERAKGAQADPAWRNLRPHERARILTRIADGIEANVDRISRIQTMDTGKTLKETRALAASAAGTFRYFAAALETADEALTTQRGDALTMSVHEPLGLVAAITPWNSPIASDAQKVAPALAAGNAVLLKPASWSPLVSLELARIVEEAGLPKGLFSVLPGAGREVGNLLVEHPDIAKVSFTGGTSTGRALARKAAEKLMPVSLELGGKSPTIVFADADIDQAIAGVLYGIFSSSGQSCIAGARLFVERPIYDSFVERLTAATERLRVGHPFSSAISIVSKEIEDPLATEFGIIADENAYGRDVGEALKEMADRLDMQDMRFLAVAVTIQQQSGGNLAEILAGLAKVIRARFRLFRRVKAITAEAQWSGKFLSAFPLVALMVILVNDPTYYDEVMDHPYFIPACFFVGILLTANLVVMRMLTNIKV